jgi:hypothetical protein
MASTSGGRPTKLTPDVQKRICDAVSAGNYYEPACLYAGISYQSLRNWIQRGEKAKSGIYFEFVEALTRAEAECEVRMVAQWRSAMPTDWRAIRDFLERRYPERWGRKERVTVAGDPEAPLYIAPVESDGSEWDHLSPSQLGAEFQETLNEYRRLYQSGEFSPN